MERTDIVLPHYSFCRCIDFLKNYNFFTKLALRRMNMKENEQLSFFDVSMLLMMIL